MSDDNTIQNTVDFLKKMHAQQIQYLEQKHKQELLELETRNAELKRKLLAPLACGCKGEEDCPDASCWVQDLYDAKIMQCNDLNLFIMRIETHLESIQDLVKNDEPLSENEEMSLRGTICLVLEKLKNRKNELDDQHKIGL